jgi:geranylgeranyl reductase family protein
MFTQYLNSIQNSLSKVHVPPEIMERKNFFISLGVFSVSSLILAKIYSKKSNLKTKTFAQYDTKKECFDIAIVGAGPSGSTLGFYLGKNGHKVLLLEKKQFPREKYCGDAVARGAQVILREMGVLQEIENENKGFYAQSGGFVSPCGNSFIGNSAVELKLGNGGAVIAIKRIVMDEKIANAAKRAGAKLTENTTVNKCKFLEDEGIWEIECTYQENPITYYARGLVCADGSQSSLARQLGFVTTEPEGVCSRAYVKDNKLFNCDGLIFYPKRLLPGYCAIIREAGDELNFCTYIIPGGKAKNEDLPKLHDEIMKNDPYVSKLLGPEPNIERMKAAPLRLGGIKKSFGNHLIIIGDAAGFIDPLTGEGIQYAMESSKMAAEVLHEGLVKGDLSEKFLKKYQDMWWKHWGWEFYFSMKMSLLLYRFPIALDAAAKMIEKKGSRFLAEWADVMTGSGSKTWFLRFDVWPFILLEIAAQIGRNLTGRNTGVPH